MSPVAACGLATCPVPSPTPDLLDQLTATAWPAGTVLHRGVTVHHPDPTGMVPATGDTRFAPLPGVAHAYVATTRFAALLEAAFHEAAPPSPRIYEAQFARWVERAVTLTHDVGLVNLRDTELARIGIDRGQLVATTATHYPCTRAWAQAIHGRTDDGQVLCGAVWDSRQRELHARALGHLPALADLVDGHPAEVAVLWPPPSPTPLLDDVEGGLGPLDEGPGQAYIDDLVALLGIVAH
ncbi:hypothetical protein BH24ACT4_BH24ACT4_09950 [soil metagenome]